MKVLTFKKKTENNNPLKKMQKKKKKMTHWTACKKHNSYLPGPFNVLSRTGAFSGVSTISGVFEGSQGFQGLLATLL